MKNISIIALFIFSAFISHAQNAMLDSLHVIIDSAYNVQDYDYALKKCDEAIAIKKTDSAANLRKATSFYYLHRIDDCISFCEKAFYPIDSAATILGILSLQDDDRSKTDSALVFADREKLVKAGLHLSNNNAYSLLGRSLLDAEAKDFDAGMEHMQRFPR